MSASVPNLHVSTRSKVTGSAEVLIQSRIDGAPTPRTGVFKIKVAVEFDPDSSEYPTGTIKITVDLSDSIKATFTSSSIDLINSFGKYNPTIMFTGRCKVDLQDNISEPKKGCKYWILIADNKMNNSSTPDIVSFVITDRTGNRIAYGTGPVTKGDLSVIGSGD